MPGNSPATGASADPGKGRHGKPGRRAEAATGPVEVALEHARWRAAMWTGIGLGFGLLLLVKLGTVGQLVGVLSCAAALVPLRGFVMTLLHPPGTLRVAADEVTLPRGLCRPEPLTLPIGEIRHAYFLRRAVPWTRTGPVLVVETDHGTFQYPRDWFATDSDQRRVAAALNRRLERP